MLNKMVIISNYRAETREAYLRYFNMMAEYKEQWLEEFYPDDDSETQ